MLGLALLSTSCATKPQHVCTLIGCLAPASFDMLAGADAATLTGANVTICVNERCASGLITTPDVPGDELHFVGPQIVTFVDIRAAAQRYDVRGGILPTDGLADGDVYTVMLQTSSGTVVVSKAWTATYTADYPNGPDCNVCLYATLQPQP